MTGPRVSEHVALSPTGREFRVERDFADVTSYETPMEPDPGWRFVDPSGHEHHYDPNRPRNPYPTLLTARGPSSYCPDCEEEHDGPSWQVCPQCGVVVTPGRRPAPNRQIVSLERFYIDQQPVTRDEFARAVEVERLRHGMQP